MKKIIQGVKNHLIKGKTSLSKSRMSICLDCEHLVNDNVFGKRCGECGCILKYKTKSEDSSCPVDKW